MSSQQCTHKNYEMVVAMDIHGCIGKNNSIPWHLPEDLAHFRELTENHIIIMGRRTFESLPNGPLKNRIHIVISNNANLKYNNPNVIVTHMGNVHSIVEQYIQYSITYKNIHKKVFVIGGAEIYKLFINSCKLIHVTHVDVDTCDGDVYFSSDLLQNFNVTSTSPKYTSKNNIIYTFVTYNTV